MERPEGDPGIQDPGSTEKRIGSKHISVSNAKGYLCHIKLTATFDHCKPATLFSLFCNPDNSQVFRDIQRVNSRRTVKSEGNWRLVEIEQVGEAKVWLKRVRFSTLLEVEEDGRDPQNLATRFRLLRSDILSKFNGSWRLSPTGSGGNATHAVLEQDLLPQGVPAFLKHVPVLGSVLRGVSVRAVERMLQSSERSLQDIDRALQRLGDSSDWDTVLKPHWGGPGAKAGAGAGAGAGVGFGSHPLDVGSDEEEGSSPRSSSSGQPEGSPLSPRSPRP